ncbi:hypothetical protein MANES_05G073550v8 [Manihot esculenta]|nr:hypothetical protein MANES_05G073550v8 [Manihot esculenta]
MSTFNSFEDVASCKATTVSQPSSTTQPANSFTHSQLEPSTPIYPSHSLPAASEIEAGCSNESKSCLWDAEDDMN